jgi:hypothetical protein
MRRVGLRLPTRLWADIRAYATHANIVDESGSIDISEAVRDLISRGLVADRSRETAYRSGYREGRLAGYKDFMVKVGGQP